MHDKMSKSILVIDTPTSCSECYIVSICKLSPKYIHSAVNKNCPLKQLPSKDELRNAISDIKCLEQSRVGYDGLEKLEKFINTIFEEETK